MKAGAMVAPLAVEFRRSQHDLSLRAALQRAEVLRVTLQPRLSHERIGGSGVERIVADGDDLTFNLAKSVAPIILNPAVRLDKPREGRPQKAQKAQNAFCFLVLFVPFVPFVAIFLRRQS